MSAKNGPRPGRVRANGLDFEYLELGSGPLALCLHGFPDSAWTWRELLRELAEAGYHAVAPWMRGFAPTSVASDGDYTLGALTADAIALHEALGGTDEAVIIGHDWGAYATYGAAAFAPERWRRAVTMAAPPVLSTANAFQRFDHSRRAWHMFFFLSPLAELAVGREDFTFIDQLWQQWSPGFDGGDLVSRAKDALRPEGHLAAALGYYRCLFDGRTPSEELAPMQAATAQPTRSPTLYLHGDQDGCIDYHAGDGSDAFLCPGSRRLIVAAAGHFLHLERPALVTREILAFLER